MTTLRPLLLIFLATLCPLLAGCLVPVGWAYPTVSIVPPAALDSTDQVRAFRVDVADQLSEIDMNGGDDYVLSEVPIPEHGILLPQTKVALDYGYVWNMIAIVYGGHTHHTALLRLYRPGFQTVEISS